MLGRASLRVSRLIGPPIVVVGALAFASTGGPACSNNDAVTPVDAAIDHATIIVTPDARVTFEATVDATPLQTNVRVALLSDLGFGIDICVSPVGSTGAMLTPYIGPLLYQKLPSFPDAGSDAATDADSGHRDGSSKDASGADSASRDAAGTTDATIDATADGSGARTGDAASDGAGDGAEAGDASDASAGDAATDAAKDARGDAFGDGASDGARDGSADATGDAVSDAVADAIVMPDGGERVGGVPANQVSTYLSVQGAGTFDVAVVLGGSSSCASPLLVTRVTLDAGKFTTLVVRGSTTPVSLDAASADAQATDASKLADASHADATMHADGAADGARDGAHDASLVDATTPAPAPLVVLTVVALTDEPALSSTFARARFFNATTASTSGEDDGGATSALRVAAVEQAATVPLAVDVPVNRVTLANPASPAVDSLGYWQGAPLVSTVPISLRASAGPLMADASLDAKPGAKDGGATSLTWTFGSTSFDLVAETNHTGFFVGNGDALELLWCDDSTSSGPSALTSCASIAAE